MELILERRFCLRAGIKQGGYHSVSSFRAEALGTGVPKELRAMTGWYRNWYITSNRHSCYILMTALKQCLRALSSVS
ncbi:hypothetical protein [Pseudomonas fluorescens]|uniref:hypothetical protein n=1 Tax=Pseudomonas fluorescens TaxID=294 RepID=UPI001269A690|nr:hypothetical protein [Pseudomonas fluorescens]